MLNGLAHTLVFFNQSTGCAVLQIGYEQMGRESRLWRSLAGSGKNFTEIGELQGVSRLYFLFLRLAEISQLHRPVKSARELTLSFVSSPENSRVRCFRYARVPSCRSSRKRFATTISSPGCNIQ